MKKILFIIIGVCLFTTVIHAQPINQEVGDVVMPPPNAAALGKYGDIPVSHFTGVPNISIPIHTVTEGKIQLPISLNYHAGGVKVGEMASWVGTGWSLNAGGVITRTVLGNRDESPLGYYLNGDVLDDLSIGEFGELIDGNRDGEPDIFNFNFPGYSGKFYFDGDGNAVFIPKQDLKLELEQVGTSSFGGFAGFTIITPEGTRYTFGKDYGKVAQEYTISGSATASVNSWYLLKIQSHDLRDSITLD